MEDPTEWYEIVLAIIVGIPLLLIMIWMAWFALRVVNGVLNFLWDVLTFFSRYR